MKTEVGQSAPRYDIVALVSNDLVTDQRMQRSLTSLSQAGYHCLLLGRERERSRALDLSLPFVQERHHLSADRGKQFYLQLNRAHYRRLLELQPRLVLAVDLDTVAAAAMAARKLSIPWIFDAHELFEEMPEVVRRPLIKAVWSLVGRLFVPRAAGAYTVGAEIAKILTRRYGLPFGVVRNFPLWQQPEAPRPHASYLDVDQPFIVLYQGAINEGRGLEELIIAASELPHLKVWIAGDGPERLRLEAFAKTYTAARVEFLGELSPEVLRELTPKAHLGYGLMRAVSRNYYLSLSNKSVDYIHAGLPSLQMDWPEYRAIHDTFGCYELVPFLSPASVKAAILKCQEPSHYAALQAKCMIAAPQLTWQGEAEVVLTLVRPLLAK